MNAVFLTESQLLLCPLEGIRTIQQIHHSLMHFWQQLRQLQAVLKHGSSTAHLIYQTLGVDMTDAFTQCQGNGSNFFVGHRYVFLFINNQQKITNEFTNFFSKNLWLSNE